MHYVICTFQVEGFHYWPDAPPRPEFAFLKNVHRHMFHITCVKSVTSTDRQIEIIDWKSSIQYWTMMNVVGDAENPTTLSCEQMAEMIGKYYGLHMCKVLEDNENGAMWCQDEKSPKQYAVRVRLEEDGSVAAVSDSVEVKLKKELDPRDPVYLGREAEKGDEGAMDELEFMAEDVGLCYEDFDDYRKMGRAVQQTRAELEVAVEQCGLRYDDYNTYMEMIVAIKEQREKKKPQKKKKGVDRRRIFYGKEAEGPDYGKSTMFIPGSMCEVEATTVHEVEQAIYDWMKSIVRGNNHNIYLGAGDDLLPIEKYSNRVLATINDFKWNRIIFELPECDIINGEDTFRLLQLKPLNSKVIFVFRADGNNEYRTQEKINELLMGLKQKFSMLEVYSKAIQDNLIFWMAPENTWKTTYTTHINNLHFSKDHN